MWISCQWPTPKKSNKINVFFRAILSLLYFLSFAKTEQNRLTSIGVMNTFKNITRWTKLEREFYKLAKSIAILEVKDTPVSRKGHGFSDSVIRQSAEFVEDFEQTTLKHLSGISWLNLPSSILSLNEKDKHDEEYLLILDHYVASSLLLLLRMTHRLTKYGDFLQLLAFSSGHHGNTGIELKSGIYIPPTRDWPGKIDLEIINHVLLTAYKFYDIFQYPADFIKTISPQWTTTPADFTADMAWDVFEVALKTELYVQAIDWINFSLELLRNKIVKLNTTLTEEFLLATKEKVLITHNKVKQNEKTHKADSGLYYHPINLHESNTIAESHWISTRFNQYQNFRGRTQLMSIEANMWALCSGELLMKEWKRAKLKCFWDTSSHSSFIINPLKVEVLSTNPEILQFHNILGNKYIDKLVNRIQEEHTTNIGVSNIKKEKRNDEKKNGTLSIRSSVHTWIHDNDFPELTVKSGIISGLQSYSEVAGFSEPFQAVEYVVGRHYGVHMDVGISGLQDEASIQTSGVRTATLLYYLNDVPMGGETVFPFAMVRALPIKGSAVFWKNTYRNGTLRNDVWHASCPVTNGFKLIINKWFRSYIQMFKFPCSSNANE